MDKKKKGIDDLKFVREKAPIITEELFEIDSLASVNECTGMGKIYPNYEGKDLDDVFDKAEINTKRLEKTENKKTKS